ncbi:hypothetical protein ACWCQL_03755 [Streptomyces sp. NPDC002073]|uniref:hypothetical protein n=1 Tax=Streptomyces sp. NBC_00239 TaxID=2903640 RepID=UPI002E2C72C5|nr:hypothetical protein [Streptomyces sp. NBC_00239]
MSEDVVQLVDTITPYLAAAAAAYGGAVLVRAQEEAATATVGLGRRLAQRIFGVRDGHGDLPDVLADLAEDPRDPDSLGAMRRALRRSLLADPALAEELRALPALAPAPVRAGDGAQIVLHSVVAGDNIQIGSVGGDLHLSREPRA